MKLVINPNILNEGNHMEILDAKKYEETNDECDLIVRCNNCGQPTEYGKTRMIHGFVGCDNKIKVNGKEVECFFEDLEPRVIDYKENHHELYRKGKVYRWRDNVDGDMND